jgi:hypothetical protein
MIASKWNCISNVFTLERMSNSRTNESDKSYPGQKQMDVTKAIEPILNFNFSSQVSANISVHKLVPIFQFNPVLIRSPEVQMRQRNVSIFSLVCRGNHSDCLCPSQDCLCPGQGCPSDCL